MTAARPVADLVDALRRCPHERAFARIFESTRVSYCARCGSVGVGPEREEVWITPSLWTLDAPPSVACTICGRPGELRAAGPAQCERCWRLARGVYHQAPNVAEQLLREAAKVLADDTHLTRGLRQRIESYFATARLLRTFEVGDRVRAACDIYYAHSDMAVLAGQQGIVSQLTDVTALVVVRWDLDGGPFFQRTTVDVIDRVEHEAP